MTKTYEVYPSRESRLHLQAADCGERDADPGRRARAQRREAPPGLLERVAASPSERAKQQKDIEENRREERDAIDELFRVYDIHIVGRETLAGYPTIVGTLDPRRDYQPRSDDGRMMKRFRARVWIHEFEYQLVKVDLESVEDVTIRLGSSRPPA